MRRAAVDRLAAALVAGAGTAETEAASWGIGIGPADPADKASLGEGIEVTAAPVNERIGEPAGMVDRADTIRLVAALHPAPEGPDRPLRLTCQVEFFALDGVRTGATEGACFTATLRTAAARPRALSPTLRFTPSPDDPAGTVRVILHLWDSVAGDKAILVPTHDWKGGR